MEIRKKSSNHNWTDEEDAVLKRYVAKYPTSTKRACTEAANELGITFYMCRNRWYKHLSTIEDTGLESNVLEAYTSNTSFALTSQVKETMDGFVDLLKNLQKQNKMLNQKVIEQDKRLTEQSRIMRDMANERKDLEESYTYILKVMEKARKMFAEDEMKEVTHKVDSSGSVDVDIKRSAG